ncbi:phage holin [Aerococcaceae bacterium WGS1372]
MPINNRTYDTLKWFALVFSPALTVFIQGVGDIYHLAWSHSIVQVINLFAVFLGAILQISSKFYQDGGGQSSVAHSLI